MLFLLGANHVGMSNRFETVDVLILVESDRAIRRSPESDSSVSEVAFSDLQLTKYSSEDWEYVLPNDSGITCNEVGVDMLNSNASDLAIVNSDLHSLVVRECKSALTALRDGREFAVEGLVC